MHEGILVLFSSIPPNSRSKLKNYLKSKAKVPHKFMHRRFPGFISIERFQSLSNPEKILSLSFWDDENAIHAWRNFENHRKAQLLGRSFLLEDYHLRIGKIIWDYGMYNREKAPLDSKAKHR